MQYSEVLGSMKQDNGTWRCAIPEDWRQGRSIFGGLQVALALRAMRALVPADVPLRILQITFVAPPGMEPVTVRARVLRAGKSAVHVEGYTYDGDQVLSVVTGVFGTRRPSKVDVLPKQPSVTPDAPLGFRFLPGVTPEFTRHFSMRWLVGGLPFTGAKLTHAVIEVGLKDAAKTGEEHVVAIADAIPPVAISLLDSPAPGSSMTWTLEMIRDRLDDLPLTGWRLDADLVAGRHGYTHQSVMVWGPGGELVAISRQCMVIFG
jgi:acyl-CoA thioesterase